MTTRKPQAIGVDLAATPDQHVEAVQEGSGPVVLVGSAEGIAILIRWARAHRFVLGEHHERIAARHGIDTEGVIFSRPIPLAQDTLIRVRQQDQARAREAFPSARFETDPSNRLRDD